MVALLVLYLIRPEDGSFPPGPGQGFSEDDGAGEVFAGSAPKNRCAAGGSIRGARGGVELPTFRFSGPPHLGTVSASLWFGTGFAHPDSLRITQTHGVRAEARAETEVVSTGSLGARSATLRGGSTGLEKSAVDLLHALDRRPSGLAEARSRLTLSCALPSEGGPSTGARSLSTPEGTKRSGRAVRRRDG